MTPQEEAAFRQSLSEYQRGFIAHCNAVAESIHGDETSKEEGKVMELMRAQLADNVRTYGKVVAEAMEIYEVGLPIHLEVYSSVAKRDNEHGGVVVIPKGTGAEEVYVVWHDEHLPKDQQDQMIAKISIIQQFQNIEKRWDGRKRMTQVIGEARKKGHKASLENIPGGSSPILRAMTALGEAHLLLAERLSNKPIWLDPGRLSHYTEYDGHCMQGGFVHEPVRGLHLVSAHIFLQQRVDKLAKQGEQAVH